MKKSIIISGLMLLLVAAACTKESINAVYAKQETLIENFIKARLDSDTTAYVVSGDCSERLVVKDTTGARLEADGTISFYYAGYVLNGSALAKKNMFATNNPDVARQTGWNLSDTAMFKVKTLNLADADLVEGLRDGLIGVRGGEECFILFSGKYGFGKRDLGTIPANSALAYHIWVESITNE